MKSIKAVLKMKNDTVFSAAEIMIPSSYPLEKWSVIACDQFTSDPGYWSKAESITSGSPSSLDLILPEAYLGTEKEQMKTLEISSAMKNINENDFDIFNGFVLTMRKLSTGQVRKGIVGKIDLEEYDYVPDSASRVRSTEATVTSRIPPRKKIRQEAIYELPHVMLFAPVGCPVIPYAESVCAGDRPLYDFELMLGGGSIKGFRINGEKAEKLTNVISEYENKGGAVLYAIGDGNHSLAAAKAHYEELKDRLGSSAKEHPARYALCEIVGIEDESIQFEPIYRIVKNCDSEDLLNKLSAATNKNDGQKISVVTRFGRYDTAFDPPLHPLTVGSVQQFIDAYLINNPSATCDYIHGLEEINALAKEPGCVGFIFDGVEKTDLFPYVEEHGPYPRKTFSMGDAKSKRYYLEMRKITF